MKKQRHFKSEREILAEIYKEERSMKRKLVEADFMECNAHKMFKTGDPGLVETARWNLAEADRLRKCAQRLKEVRLYKLGQALSAFRTMLLPGMGSDDSVVLENLSVQMRNPQNRT